MNFQPGELNFPQGFFSGAVHLGVKESALDSSWLYSSSPIHAAGVFALNKLRSPSLDDAIEKIKKPIRGLGVFSGIANTCTGKQGEETVRVMSAALANAANLHPKEVVVSFTGIIGRPFPHKEIAKKVQRLVGDVSEGESEPFSEGIWTTDTVAKRRIASIKIRGREVRFAGTAKGAGMIYPNMATMLAFITTDLKLSSAESKKILKSCVDSSFNAISVDGDSSTNDSVFLLPNGASGVIYKDLSEKEKARVDKLIGAFMQTLAKDIVRDGEGATKFIEINVRGGKSQKDAKVFAAKVANSLLVKTAIFGNDPNYGRVLMALGNAGPVIDKKYLSFSIGKIPLYKNEKVLVNHLPKAEVYLKANTDISLNVIVGKGPGVAQFFTCDIGYDYVKINAEYTT